MASAMGQTSRSQASRACGGRTRAEDFTIMHRSRLVRTFLAMLMAAATLLLAIPAANAQYEGGATLVVNNPNPMCGTTVNITGSGFAPNSTVTLTLEGSTIGTAQTDSKGAFTFPWTAPCTLVGSRVITASDGTTTLSATLTIGSTTAATSAPTALPRTGSDSGLFLRVGVLLVAAGGLLVLAARKRSHKTVDA